MRSLKRPQIEYNTGLVGSSRAVGYSWEILLGSEKVGYVLTWFGGIVIANGLLGCLWSFQVRVASIAQLVERWVVSTHGPEFKSRS